MNEKIMKKYYIAIMLHALQAFYSSKDHFQYQQKIIPFCHFNYLVFFQFKRNIFNQCSQKDLFLFEQHKC
ncbi:unnamed protein product [Paramecium octaurelia]|uniref:Uncharacterized protein n=1 Tax=Paramecium octaurelia TaxID=43137 RepID=A0A8S1TQ29_PAROT|nr:unnamed protein product [Paramecium octaurelia]